MPERERQRQGQAVRDGARSGVGAAYQELARLEAERTALLADAVAATEAHRAAQEAAERTEATLATALARLVELGMDAADVATTVDLDVATVQRLLSDHPRRPQG